MTKTTASSHSTPIDTIKHRHCHATPLHAGLRCTTTRWRATTPSTSKCNSRASPNAIAFSPAQCTSTPHCARTTIEQNYFNSFFFYCCTWNDTTVSISHSVCVCVCVTLGLGGMTLSRHSHSIPIPPIFSAKFFIPLPFHSNSIIFLKNK